MIRLNFINMIEVVLQIFFHPQFRQKDIALTVKQYSDLFEVYFYASILQTIYCYSFFSFYSIARSFWKGILNELYFKNNDFSLKKTSSLLNYEKYLYSSSHSSLMVGVNLFIFTFIFLLFRRLLQERGVRLWGFQIISKTVT